MNNDWTTTRESHLLSKQNYSVALKNMAFSEVKRYFSDVIENIKYDLELFKEKKTIWPAQCDGAISNLDTAKALVQRLCEMFGRRLYPVMVTTSGSGRELVIKLYYAHEQLDKLQVLVTAFRPLCRISSKQAEKKRTAIFRKLDLFMLHCDDIIQSMASPEEKPQAATCLHSSLLLVPQKETKQHARQPQEFTGRAFDRLPSRKPRPSYLILVKDSYEEKRNVLRPNPVEKDHATLSVDNNQERENTSVSDALLFLNGTSDTCTLRLSLESEQQSKEDLCDEGPFCS